MKKLSLLCMLLLLFGLCACSQTKTDPNVISTKYYTLTLPDEWENKYICEILEQDEGRYILDLYERTSYEEMGAGKLCSLMLFTTEDATYKEFPEYQLLAALDTAEESYYVIALFPTDVQFSEATMENYGTMFTQLPDVLYSIKPADGVEMAMP